MSIPSDHLSAFLLVHETGSFTLAAKKSGLTQSALSQKIKRLEDLLETAVFVRHSTGPKLTAAGEAFLSFARQQVSLEQEFLQNFQRDQQDLAGVLRIAGFSSVLRSVVIPSLAPLARKHPRVQLSFSQHEMGQLPGLLRSNAADLILLDFEPAFSGVEFEVIGTEKYVVIESARFATPVDVYLDHGPEDNATESFFRSQVVRQQAYRRGFMGDVYGILDGVAQGLGRAVMSEHLVQQDRRFKVVKGHKAYHRPLALAWMRQGYYSRLHKEIRSLLVSKAADFL